MPQMMPLNWMLLLLLFISILMMFVILNYFFLKINNKNIINFNKKMNNKILNWKW